MKHRTNLKIVTSLIIFTLVLVAFACNTSESGEVIDAYKELYTAVQQKDTEKLKKMMSGATSQFVEGVAAQRNKPVAEVLENGLYASTINPEMPEIRDQRIKDGKYGAVEVFVKKTGKYEQVYFVYEHTLYVNDIGENKDAVVTVLAEETKLEPEKAGELIKNLNKPLVSTVDEKRVEELQKRLNDAGAKTSVDSGWRVAVGDLFAGTFQHPEKSKAQIEAQASNTMIPYNPNINGIPPQQPNANNAAATNANVKTIQIPPANKMTAPPDAKGKEKK